MIGSRRAAALLLAGTTACGAPREPSAASDAPAVWHVDSIPRVSIGRLDGPVPYQLFTVTGVVRLGDGRLVIADGGSGELRFFGPDGAHLGSAGGAGAGPGEFRALAGLWRDARDTLYAWDRELGRLSVFAGTGAFQRVLTLHGPATMGSPRPAGRFPDGSWLVAGETGLFDEATAGRVLSLPIALNRFDADGAFQGRIGSVQGSSWFGFGVGEGLQFWTVPYTTRGSWAVAGDRVAAGDGDTPAIRILDAAGGLIGRFRAGPDARALSDDLRDRYREELLAASTGPEERRQIVEFLRTVPFPERVPVYDGLRADAAGRWWVRRFGMPGAGGREWLVFGPDGAPVARVELPAALRVFDIGRDEVLGVEGGDVDVERVVIYGLRRGA